MDNSLVRAFKLEINNKTQSLYYGRKKELNKLISILEADEGGATLISGDRGSGKTSSIKEAIRQATTKKRDGLGRILRYTRISKVAIDVPLVPEYNDDTSLRKDILRLIVQSLVVEYDSSNLIKKIRYPITYSRRLNEIEESLRYSNITKNFARKISSNLGTFKLGSEFASTTQYEYNLAYADIELLLKAFFSRYSKILGFVIIFDELDKYGENNSNTESLRPHQYIRHLKNLFTNSYAKFLFTSTESYYHEIDENSASNALRLNEYQFNLFTHRILFNQLLPGDYKEFLKKMFKTDFKNLKPAEYRDYRIFEQHMAWYTNCYPFITKKKISEIAEHDNNGSQIVDLVDVNDSFVTRQSQVPSMQYVVDLIFTKLVTKSELSNRYLYKALRKAAAVLYQGDELIAGKSNLYGIIFYDKVVDSQFEKLVNTPFKSTDRIELKQEDVKSWEWMLEHSESSIKSNVNTAITELIWYLDALDIVECSAYNSDNIITIGLTNPTEDTLDNTINRFETISDEIEILSRTLGEAFDQLEEIVYNTSIDLSYVAPHTFIYDYDASVDTSDGKGWVLKSLILEDTKKVREEIIKARSEVAKKFITDLLNQYNPYIYSSYKTHSMSKINTITKTEVGLFNGKKLMILVNPSNGDISKQLNSNEVDKIVIINEKARADKIKVRNNHKLKYFHFSNDTYINYPTLNLKVRKYVNDFLELKSEEYIAG